jgi:hypothetical protein
MKIIYLTSGFFLILITISLIPSCEVDKQSVPVLTTYVISHTTQTSAVCGGIIITDGGYPITACGVCWSTGAGTTMVDNKTLDTIESGSFKSYIQGLNTGTRYYVRAYATNSDGTGYGSEQTFTTLPNQAQLEEKMIQDYLGSNPLLHYQLQPGGLYYLETLRGTGPAPETNDSVYVLYTMKYFDGRILGSNMVNGFLYGFPANTGKNITGFDQGIMLMKEGGKAMTIVPSYLGYGTETVAWIPGYTTLLFDVELVRVVKN